MNNVGFLENSNPMKKNSYERHLNKGLYPTISFKIPFESLSLIQFLQFFMWFNHTVILMFFYNTLFYNYISTRIIFFYSYFFYNSYDSRGL